MRVGNAGGSVKPGGVAGVGLQQCFQKNSAMRGSLLSMVLDGKLWRKVRFIQES